ncbi:MAG: S66 peptidase family protein [Bacillota bacterium]
MLAKCLRVGQTIGVVSPASPVKPDVLDRGIAKLENLGFKVKVGKYAYARHGYLAGSDRERAEDLNRMFVDTDVDAIVCSRGGYGTPRILRYLDYEAIAQNPKVFVGFSDITALHVAIRQRTGLVTFHGPMVASDFSQPHVDDYNWPWFQKAVMQVAPLGRIAMPTQLPAAECIVPGQASGELIGGNLSLVAATMGSPYQLDPTDKIILLEEVGEEPYRVDRMLTQLELAGFWQRAVGLIVGETVGCEPSNPENPSLMAVLKDKLGRLPIPVLYGLPLGHGDRKATIPEGIRASLDAEQCLLSIEEAAVKD